MADQGINFTPAAASRIVRAVQQVEGAGRIGPRSPERYYRGGGDVAPGTASYQVLMTLVTGTTKSVVWDYPRVHS